MSIVRPMSCCFGCNTHVGSLICQPKYAAYLNLIEPWWKTLRSSALRGCRFETWEEVVKAIEEATV